MNVLAAKGGFKEEERLVGKEDKQSGGEQHLPLCFFGRFKQIVLLTKRTQRTMSDITLFDALGVWQEFRQFLQGLPDLTPENIRRSSNFAQRL